MAYGTTFANLKKTHPRLDVFRVRKLRALYAGGHKLLDDAEVMAAVFPKHALEKASSYAERKLRAFYDGDFALTINKVVAGLAQDPVRFDDGGVDRADKDAKPLADYWAGIQKNANPPSLLATPARTFDQVIREVVTEALVSGWGWMLCDLPVANPEITTKLEEELAAADRAYPVPHTALHVRNWHEKDGVLRWVRTYSVDVPLEDFTQDRKWVVHTWKVWTDSLIITWELELDAEGKTRDGVLVKDDDVIDPVDERPHSFGVVPWVRFDCSEDGKPQMHLGDMIESRVRSLFNEANGDSFLRLRSMFQQLYEFLGPEGGSPDQEISEAQENPHRASRSMTNRAPDIVQIRGSDDDAKFVAPDMGAAAINTERLADGREAIPRITGQLALSSDTSGAMIKRSGESKAQDKVAEEVVLGAVGKWALSFARSVQLMLARGRGEGEDDIPPIRGYENFSTEDTAARVEEHSMLATSPIKSATFQVEHQILVIKSVLGDSVSPEKMAQIREELEGVITQDAIDQAGMPEVPDGHELGPDGKPIPKPDSETVHRRSLEAMEQKAKLAPKKPLPAKAKKK